MPQQLDSAGKKWRVSARDASGNRHTEVIYGGKREANQRQSELKAKWGRRPSSGGRGPTVSGQLREYLSYHEGQVGARTMEGYRSLSRNLLEPALGGIRLRDLTRDDIRAAYQSLHDSHSQTTIRHAHTLLKAALDHAAAADPPLIIANPARAGKLLDAGTRRKLTPPPLAAVNATLTKLRETDMGRRVYGPALVALDTGARRGEVLALKWQDLDLERGTMVIERALEQGPGGIVVKGPKTADGNRVLVLTRRAVEMLKRHESDLAIMRESLGERWDEQGWVFPTMQLTRDRLPGRAWGPTAFTTAFTKATKAAGQPLGMHALRRLHATTLEHQGISQTEIAAQLGHADTTVTKRHYLFSVDAANRAAAEAFERAISEA